MMKPTEEQIEVAAAAIANARAGRRGMPPVSNVLEILEMLPGKLLEEVREDARAALDAVSFAELEDALRESVKLQSHYAKLLNMHDGGERLIFASAEEWTARIKEVRERT